MEHLEHSVEQLEQLAEHLAHLVEHMGLVILTCLSANQSTGGAHGGVIAASKSTWWSIGTSAARARAVEVSTTPGLIKL